MDATWSVRIPENMKEKISKMITESGLNSKDFLTQAIQIYELKTAKKLQPVMQSDIDELTQLTGRVHDIFINLCERLTNFQKKKAEDFASKLKEKDEMIAVFNDRIKAYEEKLLKNEEETKNSKEQCREMFKKCTHLNDACEANKALVAEYKEKNESLNNLLEEYKKYKSIIEEVENELREERKIRESSEQKLQENDKKIKQLKTQMSEAKKNHQTELNNKLELCQIQKEKEVLEVKKEYQQNLESAHKEYTAKIKELLDIIEDQKKKKPSRKTSRKSTSKTRKS